MARVQRNDPCPCGSGKKYKKCCLRQEADEDRRDRLEKAAAGLALNWLDQHYEAEIGEILRDGFFGALDQEELSRLPEEYLDGIFINAREYALCDGLITAQGPSSPVPVPMQPLSLVLGPDGPLMDVVQREYLEKLKKASMSVYEVMSVRPGQGMELQDLLDEERPVVEVFERRATESLRVGNVLAARIVPGPKAKLSGAIYPFPGERSLPLLSELREAAESSFTGLDLRRLKAEIIVSHWLEAFIAPPPNLRDALGDSVLLVTDHYRVKDRAGLEAALAAQPDVSGDPEHSWARLEDPEGDFSRTLLAINPGKTKDRIEVFGRTQRMADEGREWFQAVAGDTVEFIAREAVDPLSPQVLEGARRARKSGAAAEPIQLPEGFLQSYMENQLYKNWADEPVPALDGKTPREAIRSDKGRRQVVDLLDSYRRGEAQQAAQEGRDAVDFSFLWDQLGLKAEGESF